MIWLLLACGPSRKSLCSQAEQEADAAWYETVAYYERVADVESSKLSAARAELQEAYGRREAAVASRNAYSRRSVGGLEDMRTGEVHRDADANASNRRRAAAASARVREASEYEAGSAADWMEVELRARQLVDRREVARLLRDEQAPLEEAEELVDTTLAVTAVRARRRRAEACRPD